MKTTKIFTAAALLVFAAMSMGAVPAKEETKQCGVTNAQIQRYLETCSHHHTVYSVWDVPGTCNSKATIENCKTATVFVSEGEIIGHMDANGICE